MDEYLDNIQDLMHIDEPKPKVNGQFLDITSIEPIKIPDNLNINPIQQPESKSSTPIIDIPTSRIEQLNESVVALNRIVNPKQTRIVSPTTVNNSRRDKISSDQNLLNEIKSPVKSIEIKSPVKSIEIKSPVKSIEIKSPVKSIEIKSPSRTTEVKSPAKSIEVKSPSRTTEVKSPAKSIEVKSPSRTTEVKSPSRTTEVKSPNRTTEVKSPNRTTEVKSPNRTTEVKSPNRTTEIKSPNRPIEIKSSVRSNSLIKESANRTNLNRVTSPVRLISPIGLPQLDGYEYNSNLKTRSDIPDIKDRLRHQLVKHQHARLSNQNSPWLIESANKVTEIILDSPVPNLMTPVLKPEQMNSNNYIPPYTASTPINYRSPDSVNKPELQSPIEIYPGIDVTNSNDDKEYFLWANNLTKLKNDNPTYDIKLAQPGENWRRLKERYDQCKLIIDEAKSANWYQGIMTMAIIGMEILSKVGLGIDATGFSQSQYIIMNNYEESLRELTKSQGGSIMAGWSPGMKILLSFIFYYIGFLVIKLLLSYVPADFAKDINNEIWLMLRGNSRNDQTKGPNETNPFSNILNKGMEFWSTNPLVQLAKSYMGGNSNPIDAAKVSNGPSFTD
jgi:hypothetical protein